MTQEELEKENESLLKFIHKKDCEIARLREALREIANLEWPHLGVIDIAKKVLEGEKDE